MYCENCGKEIKKNSKYCKNCGKKIKPPEEILNEIKKDFKEKNYTNLSNKIQLIENAIPEDIILKLKGDISFVFGNFSDAKDFYLKIPKQKREWDVSYNLALICINENDIKTAIDFFESIDIKKINPQKSLIYHDKYDSSEKLIVDINLYLGVLYKNIGKNKQAINAFKNVLKYDDKNELSYANLGDIYFKDGNYDLAIENYNRAIKITSDNNKKSNLYNDLGFSYFRKGLINDAMDCFKNSVILNPDNINAIYNLGLLYVKSGMKEEIKDDYKEFLKYDGGIEILFNLSKSIVNIAKQESELISSIDFIGESEGIKKVKETIIKAAESDSTVFIQGENGTGKELVARAIHKLSRRAEKPFVVVNCGALPETLLESELFGYEKGAFTGAIKTKPGRFEIADGGTIFLDEIGDITPAMQVKLLRFIQYKEFERIGGNETIKVDVRLITATNKDIKEMVKNGSFREDLFYRIYVLPISLPPLRERGNDIVLLAQYFLKTFSERYNKKFKNFSDDVLRIFLKYNWPGNVRQLENIIERIVTLYDDVEVKISHVPDELLVSSEKFIDEKDSEINFDIIEILKSVNYDHKKAAKKLKMTEEYLKEKLNEINLDEIMRRAGNSPTKAAKILGISRMALWKRLHKKTKK
ncbi:MAG: sigma 54-interacting transcriptional regulator [Candidatus Goldbacteria bacterium]|nr:sigma 54-interacting transcriptional regulator [Candidatus Goldiibacteriota bacterium]